MNDTIPIELTKSPRPRPADAELGFGKFFADHMLLVDYTAARGWHDARIVPYGPLALEPAADLKVRYGADTREEAFFSATGRGFEDEEDELDAEERKVLA